MAATEVYTRGKPGDPDNRGESLVQQHLDRMQQQKETVAMDKLRLLMPQVGDVVRALALAKSDWDIDQAVAMLRSFQVAHLDKLNTLNKKRKKIREDMEGYDPDADGKPSTSGGDGGGGDGGGKKAAKGGGASGSSRSESGSSSDSDGSGERRKSKKSKRSSSRKHKQDKDRSKDKDRKRSKKHKRDKKKRSKRKAGSGGSEDDEDAAGHKLTHTEDFGKYGYLREADAPTLKANEFTLWLAEVKGANAELLGRPEEKELWKLYVEDYNTGTLPHKKYYDLEAWQRYEAAKAAQAARKAGGAAPKEAAFDVRADEEAVKRRRMEERMQFQRDRLNEAYNLLKNTDRAKDMREQELLRAEMALAYKTGDRARAQKIFDRLQPDEQKK